MNIDQVYSDLKPVLAEIGKKIGQGGEFVWEVLVRQQIAEGVYCLFGGVVCLAIILVYFLWMIPFVNKKFKEIEEKKKRKSDDEGYCGYISSEVPMMISVFGSLIAVGAFIGLMSFAYYAIMNLANPEFQAIKEIFNQIQYLT